MEIVLIDDEQLQLDLLESKIHELTEHEVIGKYINPHHGLFEILKKQPDLVFLDISMPEISGMELAKEIKAAHANIKIIFLTAFDEFAVDAFELGVEDYMLKPVDDERLLHAFARITSQPIKAKDNQINYYINCFQKLQFRNYLNKNQLVNVKWRTAKSKEVFAYLLHNRNKQIRKDILIELVWPDTDVKQAYTQLYSAIYQIRNSLKDTGFQIDITSAENSYSLELTNCTTDVDMFEKGIDDTPFITKENIHIHKNILDLYTGDYFVEEDFPWAENEKKRLHIKWMNQMKRVAEFHMLTKNYPEAILIYLHLQKVSPFHDDSYFMLMKLYQKMEDRFAVQEQYQALKDMLFNEFEEEPSLDIQGWFDAWKVKNTHEPL